MSLGDRLRIARKRKGCTLKQVHAEIGISFSFLSDIERGRTNPSLDTLRKLSEFYGVAISELVSESITNETQEKHMDALEKAKLAAERIDEMKSYERASAMAAEAVAYAAIAQAEQMKRIADALENISGAYSIDLPRPAFDAWADYDRNH
jgi:transcriptional regulator with XRE-family HTH domain